MNDIVEPLYLTKVLSYIQMLETISLNSTREGISVDFHFRALTRRAACKMLQTTVLKGKGSGIASIPSRTRNSGPVGHKDCCILVIRPTTLSQNDHKRGHDQKICRMDPPEPQDRQQHGDAVGKDLDSLRGINTTLLTICGIVPYGWHMMKICGPI